MSIWAGGHVRREDATNGDALIQCAMRELVEEIRLNVEPEELRLIGAVYLDTGGSISKHVGIAYELKAKTNDGAVALSSDEFFERRGTSLRVDGKWGLYHAPDEHPRSWVEEGGSPHIGSGRLRARQGVVENLRASCGHRPLLQIRPGL
jgi:8-oxo-dGTP pyrophosphatase MutT (NUDIX family)